MEHGFTVFVFGKDWFYKTEHVKRTKKLALEILNSIQNYQNRFFNVGEMEIKYIFDRLNECTIELKTIENGIFKNKQYYSVHGNNFSIVGGFIGENDEIIYLNMEV